MPSPPKEASCLLHTAVQGCWSQPAPEIPVSAKPVLHAGVGGGRQISLQAMLNLSSLHSEEEEEEEVEDEEEDEEEE